MKTIEDIINESNGFCTTLQSHKKTYNSFIKWYDKQLDHMNKEELLDMLKFICQEIEDDSLDFLK